MSKSLATAALGVRAVGDVTIIRMCDYTGVTVPHVEP